MKLGLRAKTSAVFAAGALGVSGTVTIGTYELTRRALVAERERTAVRAAYFDAAVVRQGITSEDPGLVDVLRSLDTGQTRRPLIFRDGEWFARTADTGSTATVPQSLRNLVARGVPAVQRVRLNGQPSLVVGVPLRGSTAQYYELTSQSELQRTLRQVALSLIAVAIATTIAAASLGQWASRRLLRPLTSVAHAARSLGRGDLSARLQPQSDPDLRPLTQSFNDMAAELQTRIERDRRFAGDVSHELRSPLQTLTTATDVLLKRRERLDARTAAAVELVAAEIGRFSALVRDLLELARADQGAVRTDIDVTDVLMRLGSQLSVPSSCLRVDAGLSWPLEQRRFERIAANLIENAQLHGGGVALISCTVEGAQLHLVVEDNGPGVPLEERGMIFSRFGRGRRASSRGAGGDGTGLGLSLVAQHVAAHAGAVTVGEAEGGGARFDVILPGRDA